jgi:hypothetical protein
MLNHNLSQKLKLIGMGKYNHLINTLTINCYFHLLHVSFLYPLSYYFYYSFGRRFLKLNYNENSAEKIFRKIICFKTNLG